MSKRNGELNNGTMDMNMPSSSNAHNTVNKNLLGQAGNSVIKRLGWKQESILLDDLGDEDEGPVKQKSSEGWSKKAIDSLMKKLQKHNKDSLQMLDTALKTQGREPSCCVTIPRSLDGRLQISHRKALPHVIYCRVYRWPDLQSHHELKAIQSCRFCFESGQKDICINPYHYERIDAASILPPVLVPRYSDPPPTDIPMNQAAAQNYMHSFHPNVDMSSAATPADLQRILAEQNEQAQRHLRLAQQFGGEPQNWSPQTFDSFNQLKFNCPQQANLNEMTSLVGRVPVPYVPCKYWATISYYELNNRLGDQFKASSNTVYIDGFTDPNTQDKISLGLFSNVNRNTTIENTRRQIGKGVKLTYVPYQGTLYAECLSDSPIFIQSRNCNYMHNFHPTTVCKINNGYSLKVFDTGKFGELLSNSINMGFNSSYELTKLTIIRMSFVKGWGAEYNRQDVTSTPCWVEIHLHAPLIWLDRALAKLGPSSDPISSIS